MAPRAKTNSLRLVDPPDENVGSSLEVEVPGSDVSPGMELTDEGVLKVRHEDGSLTVDFNPDLSDPDDEKDQDGFYRNLANDIDKTDAGMLASIATDLLEGIDRDDQSRKDWLSMRERGITLLGLKLEEPRGDVGTSSAPLEGMSTVRHPLLLDATIRFQATARGELLPASGPVKVRNDSNAPPKAPVGPGGTAPVQPPPAPQQPNPLAPQQAPQAPNMAGGPPPGPPPLQAPLGAGGGGQQQPPGTQPPPTPPNPMMGHNGGPPLENSDDLAEALEKDFNHYLTVTATEYVPDTDRMLFYVGFGGDGFKKVYNCPLRRRPVSESVDAEDLIVSNAATDLRNCGRVTHKIRMRKSILKRMQIVGAYRDVKIETPSLSSYQLNQVEQKKAEIQGQSVTIERPQDRDYTIYESYCELDLDQFAPKELKGKGLPLPYRVTIEKDSRQILSIIRNWKIDDEDALPKQFFVQFPFIRGLGFYGLGFIHVLGNTTNTLTAAWREMLDAGMFASFPGGLVAKSAARQLTNQFRCPPGGFIPIDLGAMQNIRDLVMPLPYKEVGPSFTAFITHVEEVGQRLAQTADMQIGEGKQDAPVGTTLALIEQATKLIDSVHKRLHWSQNEEFALLAERFREDPEAFWRHNKKPTKPWEKALFLKALDNHKLVPVADPNNPTSLHRMAKATAVEGLASKYPQLLDTKAALERVFRVAGIDSEGLFRPEPLPQPPDPRMVAIQQKAQTSSQQQQIQNADSLRKAQLQIAQLSDKAKDRESRERIEQLKIVLEGIRFQEESIIHANDAQQERERHVHEIVADRQKAVHELQLNAATKHQELRLDHASRASEIQMGHQEHAHDLSRQHQEHQQRQEHDRQAHQQKLQHERELHAQRLEHEQALAKIRKTSNKAKGKSE